jgi:acyl-CoA synthetase (NDP forming)
MKGPEFIKIKGLLAKYNIPFCPSELIEKETQALSFAESFGYPVVLKIFSIEGIHKTDQGLLRLNIKNKEELINSFKELNFSVFNKNGILIQKQLFGIETVVGMKRDNQFGPVLMFGSGGILVELIKDISFRIAPIKEKDAMEMIKETKGYKLLEGFRGEKPIDIKKLSNIILSLSNLSISEKDIKEIDFNPVIVNQEGAFVVDPRIILN